MGSREEAKAVLCPDCICDLLRIPKMEIFLGVMLINMLTNCFLFFIMVLSHAFISNIGLENAFGMLAVITSLPHSKPITAVLRCDSVIVVGVIASSWSMFFC